MLKTISAALLAVSVIAAPALAAETGKTATPAPATTTAPATTAPATKAAPVIKSEQLPSKVRNANAKLHHKHYRHHRHHKHMGMLKVKSPKHATKHVHAKVASKLADWRLSQNRVFGKCSRGRSQAGGRVWNTWLNTGGCRNGNTCAAARWSVAG